MDENKISKIKRLLYDTDNDEVKGRDYEEKSVNNNLLW